MVLYDDCSLAGVLGASLSLESSLQFLEALLISYWFLTGWDVGVILNCVPHDIVLAFEFNEIVIEWFQRGVGCRR
ncbi:hypothetical protein C6Y55_08765 [Stenotrophomonas maltophilia]|nr:hypothetical protein C6Y55_08765 [Stenotrophomonas maltophilia]